MARKSKKASTRSAGAKAAPASPEAPFRVIEVPPGGTATVIVDVGPMAVPYAVSYAGKTIVKSVVDRAQALPLLPGEQVLGWAFTQMVKEWHHTIGVSVNGATPIVLESMSEADKDQDVSVNFTIVSAGGGA